MDWDRMNKIAAATGSFAGRGRADEDAYYAAFANDDKPSALWTALSALRKAMKDRPLATSRVAMFK